MPAYEQGDFKVLADELYEESVTRLMRAPIVHEMARALPEHITEDQLGGSRARFFRDMVNAMYDLYTDGLDYVRPINALVEAIFRLRRHQVPATSALPSGAVSL